MSSDTRIQKISRYFGKILSDANFSNSWSFDMNLKYSALVTNECNDRCWKRNIFYAASICDQCKNSSAHRRYFHPPSPSFSLSSVLTPRSFYFTRTQDACVCELMSSLKNFYYDIYCGYVPELLPSLCNIQHSLFTIQRRGVVNAARFVRIVEWKKCWTCECESLFFGRFGAILWDWIEIVVCLDISLNIRLWWKKDRIGHFGTILQFFFYSSGMLTVNVHG